MAVLCDTSKIEIDGIDLTGDLSRFSDEELWSLRDKAWRLAAQHMSMQVTVKTCRNSMYGATSNKHYAFCNIDVAEDITAEGRNYIHHGERLTNEYFNEKWHLDTELHQKLREDPDLRDGFIDLDMHVRQLPRKDRVMYIDTDSLYINYEDCLRSIGFVGKSVVDANKSFINEKLVAAKSGDSTAAKELLDWLATVDIDDYHVFITHMADYRMTPYYNENLAKLVAERFGKSVLMFDVETVADTAIFLAKKQYIQTIKWADGRTYEDPSHHIKAKGVELIKSSSSILVRNMLNYGYQQFLTGKCTNELAYRKLVRKLWKRFEAEEDEELLCMFTNADKFAKNVLDDVDTVKVASGCLPQYRGAALHNWLLRQMKLQDKYKLIENDRLYWFFIDKNKLDIKIPFPVDAFSFIPGDFPTELKGLIRVDKGAMFHKLVVRPLERIAIAVGIRCNNPLSSTYAPGLLE